MNNSKTHTKRSLEFQDRIDEMAITIEQASSGGGRLGVRDAELIIEVLRKYTTDNPYKFSPALIFAWSQLYDEALAERTRNPALASSDSPRSTKAMECAETMTKYHTRKFPD